MPATHRIRSVPNTKYLLLFSAAVLLLLIGLVSGPTTWRALGNSATLAIGTTAIALPLGTLLAVLLARFDLPARRAAAICLGVLLFLPLYVQLAGWDAAIGKLGWFSLSYGSMSEPLLAGMRGAIWVHAMAAVPWITLLVGLGLLQADPAQEEAALLVAPPAVVLGRITLPQTAPFIVAAAIWAVVSTTSEMTVTNIFLINLHERTYTEQLYMTFSLTADATEAALAVLSGVLGLAVLIACTLLMVTQLIHWPALARPHRPLLLSPGGWRLPLTALLWSLILTLFTLPIASLISKAGFVVRHEDSIRVRAWSAIKCLTEVLTAPWRFASDFRWTLIVAAAAATIALAVGVWLAWLARRGPPRAWRMLPAIAASVLGLAIPGPLVGVALIWLLNHDLSPYIPLGGGNTKSWLLVLYDETPLAPILAQAIRAAPLATLLSWHSFRTISDDVLDAAALDGLSPRQVLWHIVLPQRRSALAGAWLAAFAVAAGDLAWALLVIPPGLDMIQRRVFGLVHSGVEEQVAAISLVNVLAYTLIALLTIRLMNVNARRSLPRKV